MTLLNSIRLELRKTIVSKNFLLAIFVMTLLCFSAEAYIDVNNGALWSVADVLFKMDEKTVSQNIMLSAIPLYSKTINGYAATFVPIIVSSPFAVILISEKSSGYKRFSIARSGKNIYYFTKIISAIITGGCVALLSNLIFFIIIMLLAGDTASYIDYSFWKDSIIPFGFAGTVIRRLLANFLYGAMMSMPALVISTICDNKYLVSCIPFMFVYLWFTINYKIEYMAEAAYDFRLVDKCKSYSPTSAFSLAYVNSSSDSFWRTIIFIILYFVFFISGFIINMNLKKDKGV